MIDTSSAIDAMLRERYAAMSGSERALMALQMFETAQHIVLSSLAGGMDERDRRREYAGASTVMTWRGARMAERA